MASSGHPYKFQRLSRLGSVTAWHSSSGRQPNSAALNRGRHLYLAGRPSRWALAHILVVINLLLLYTLLSYTNTVYKTTEGRNFKYLPVVFQHIVTARLSQSKQQEGQHGSPYLHLLVPFFSDNTVQQKCHCSYILTRMWANAQPDGRPAEHRWRPLFNAAKFG